MNNATINQQQASIKLREEITSLLNWNDHEYAEYMFEHGLEFLKYYCCDDQEAFTHCTLSKEFWNFWKQRWIQRDEIFAAHFNQEWLCHQSRVRLYIAMHNPKVLVAELTIPRVVFKTFSTTVNAHL
jgi:hypothetical protein